MARASSLDGAVAQLGERLVCNQEATGSIPVSSTNDFVELLGALGGLPACLGGSIVSGVKAKR